MTNPHPTIETNIDIRMAADRVIEHLRQGRYEAAFQVLDRERADERRVVQESLDRYVCSGGAN